MRYGIEFEYLLVDLSGPEQGRIRDFGNLDFQWISQILEDKPGRADPQLATGDLGIKAGYWYLEGDERFHPDGRFRTLEVKGVEIRTPPAHSVEQTLNILLEVEAQLSRTLAARNLGLAIAGFNPTRAHYDFVPPLNPWEQALRQRHRSYDGSHVSTLSYGPDINLSQEDWSREQIIDGASKLNHYAPYLVPFSFSSPFHDGKVWHGWSRRTFERCCWRPAVKAFLAEEQRAGQEETQFPLLTARIPGEHGRIEFKAFDAIPDAALLAACCHLLEGVLLDSTLRGRSPASVALYQQAALLGFQDPQVAQGAGDVLNKAAAALQARGRHPAAEALEPLYHLLEKRRTPAHELLEYWWLYGCMYHPGGLRDAPMKQHYSYA